MLFLKYQQQFKFISAAHFEFKRNNLRHDYYDLVSIFENPSISKILYFFIEIGGWVIIVSFFLSLFLYIKISLILIEYQSSIIKNLNSKPNIIKNLNFIKNFKEVIKAFSKQNNKNCSISDTIVQFIITIIIFFTIMSIFLLINKLIISNTIKRFRFQIFEEFLNKVTFESFANPQECIKFTSSVFSNLESFINASADLASAILQFCIYTVMCFQINGNNLWKILLLIWLFAQMLLAITPIIFFKDRDTLLLIQNIENGYIYNNENQKLFGMFTNSSLEYSDLLEEIFSHKKQNILYAIIIASISALFTTCCLGGGIIFSLCKTGCLLMMMPKILKMLDNFQRIPKTAANFIDFYDKFAESFTKFKCDQNFGDYIILNKETVKDNFISTNGKSQVNKKDIEKYLKKIYNVDHVLYKKSTWFIPKKKIEIINSIHFKNGDFKYPNSKLPKGTNNMNFLIKKHHQKPTVVLVMGSSGSGKSTLILLILNIFKLNKGQILVNDVPLLHINETDLYKKSIIMLQFTKFIRTSIFNSVGGVIGINNREKIETTDSYKDIMQKYYIYQDIFLHQHILSLDNLIICITNIIIYCKQEYNFNLKEILTKLYTNYLNINEMKKEFNSMEYLSSSYHHFLVNKAINESGLSKFVDLLPEKMFSIIAEGGTNFSGGMRQMISLARVIIQIYYAKILNIKKQLGFFDEPVASLDAKSALKVANHIISIIMEFNLLSFITDHTGIFLKLLNNNENIDLRILFFNDQEIIYSTADELLNNEDFVYLLKKCSEEQHSK